MRTLSATLTAVLVLAAAVASVPTARGQQSPGGEDVRMVALNFADNIDVRVLAKWISEVTGEVFAYDETFQGTIRLEVPKELPESALMPLFESVLKLKGFALVRRGELTMIVQSRAATKLDTNVVLPAEDLGAEGTDFVSKVVDLKYADAQTVATALQPFMTSAEAVKVIGDHNKVAFSDYADNVQRALAIIAFLDRKGARPVVVLRTLEHARADDMVQYLQTAFETDKGKTGPRRLPIFAADQRTNSLLVVTTEEDVTAIETVIQTLDVEAAEPERPVRIYRLRNIKAADVNKLLEELLQGMRQAAEPRATGLAEAGTSTTGEQTGIEIVADEASNSLIVAATREDHAWLEALLQDLDKRRPQVLIEAWIISLSEEAARELGVELSVRGTSGSSEGVGTTFFGLSGVDETTGERGVPSPPGTGLTLAVVGPDDIRAILRAVETKDIGRILSRPRLLANDNQKAVFQRVREEPFVTISAITASTSTTSFGGFEKAGTTLEITPTICEDDYVFLDIVLSVSNFTGTAPAAQTPPPREENRIETGVTVPNQSAIVIGGIVGSEELEAVRKVPILGDIPLLGALFRSKRTDVTTNTLYAFIRPQIFSAEDFSDIVGVTARSEEALRQMGAPESGAVGEEGDVEQP
jgi:general secretion pathway protein D